MRCGGCGVDMPNFSEAPASITLMWICGALAGDQTKILSLYLKKVYTKLSIARRMGQLLIYIHIYSYIYGSAN